MNDVAVKSKRQKGHDNDAFVGDDGKTSTHKASEGMNHVPNNVARTPSTKHTKQLQYHDDQQTQGIDQEDGGGSHEATPKSRHAIEKKIQEDRKEAIMRYTTEQV